MTARCLTIRPVDRPVDWSCVLPGSKSITNRALLMAAMADGPSVISNALFSDDTRRMSDALAHLGIPVHAERSACQFEVDGRGGQIPAREADLYVGNAGTAARFLTAFLATGHGSYRLDGDARMRERPIGDLLSALRALGVRVTAELRPDAPPIVLEADGIPGGDVVLDASRSSQYVTALLMVAPLCPGGLRLRISGAPVSEPYVSMTLAMMAQRGIVVRRPEPGTFEIAGGQQYAGGTWHVEPDASAASYFLAAGAVTGGTVVIEHLGRDSVQGDVGFAQVLRDMGCSMSMEPTRIRLTGPRMLHGVDVDMNGISDTVMTLAAIAPFADSPTRIRNIAHIRHKETDRIAALATELRRLGVPVDEFPDGLAIMPARIRGSLVHTYNDHRMAMSFSVMGLRAPGVTIDDPVCVSKTFPDYFHRLRGLSHT